MRRLTPGWMFVVALFNTPGGLADKAPLVSGYLSN